MMNNNTMNTNENMIDLNLQDIEKENFKKNFNILKFLHSKNNENNILKLSLINLKSMEEIYQDQNFILN